MTSSALLSRLVAVVLLALVAGGAFVLVIGAGDRGDKADAGVAAPLASGTPFGNHQEPFVHVVQTVSSSVVEVRTAEGLGSGIVFDGGGDIVTNAHVVGDAHSF